MSELYDAFYTWQTLENNDKTIEGIRLVILWVVLTLRCKTKKPKSFFEERKIKSFHNNTLEYFESIFLSLAIPPLRSFASNEDQIHYPRELLEPSAREYMRI